MTAQDWIVVVLMAAVLTVTVFWDRHVQNRDRAGDQRAHRRLMRELERQP